MSDPLSICASVIAVTTLAYASSKALWDVIQTIKDAPQTIADLSIDINTLQAVLSSLTAELETANRPHQLSASQLAVLSELTFPLKSCAEASAEFEARLSKLLSRSLSGRTSFRDSVKLHFFEKEIAAFRFRLGSYKSTLTIALSFATMRNTTQTTSALQTLEAELQDTRQLLSGQMQGLTMSLEQLAHAGDQVQDLVQRSESQVAVLAQCLAVCMTTWSGCTEKTGVTAKYARALDDSKQLLGNIGKVSDGAPALVLDILIAQGRAQQVAGNIEGSIALAILNAPPSQASTNRRAGAAQPPALPFA